PAMAPIRTRAKHASTPRKPLRISLVEVSTALGLPGSSRGLRFAAAVSRCALLGAWATCTTALREVHAPGRVRTSDQQLRSLLLATCTETLTNNRPTNPQSVAVLTQHNDNTRSGWNDKETALTTSNVNVQQFGAVFTLRVDDQVYAQPLVVGHVSVGGGDRNVVYIATVNNTLYAYDGDDGTLYWQRGVTAPGMRPPSNTDMTGACGGSYQDFSGNIGIVGTSV